MLIQSVARLLKGLLPGNLYGATRRAYFEVLFRLGPRFAMWRLRRATRNPVTHRQKVRHKVAYDRDPQLTILCDKIRVRDFVAQTIGSKYLTEAYFLGYDLDEIDWHGLPREYVCKVNHGAGGVIIVHESASPSLKLPDDPSALDWTHLEVHPENADPYLITAVLKHWLSLDYSWTKDTLFPEWAYRAVPRGVIIEELLHVDRQTPNDYKSYVVHGEVKLIRVLTNRLTNARGLYEYDREWNFVGSSLWSNSWTRLPGDPPEIANFKDVSPRLAKELVDVSEALGVATDALRVDLYALSDRVVFGETTIYPNAGDDFFTHDWIDTELGKDWHQTY